MPALDSLIPTYNKQLDQSFRQSKKLTQCTGFSPSSISPMSSDVKTAICPDCSIVYSSGVFDRQRGPILRAEGS